MGGSWPVVQLGDVADLQVGYAFKSNEFTDDSRDPRLLRGANVGQGIVNWESTRHWSREDLRNLDRYWLRAGDVIVAMDRPWIPGGLKYGVVRPGDLPALLVQRVARLRGGPRLDTGFLQYVIGSRAFTDYVLAVQTGTTIPHISGAQIEAFNFQLPPLSEQRRIASTLGALDDKIELNRRMSETLEQIARTQFRDWFADKLGKVQAGEYPSWTVKPLDEIADFLNGAACQRFPQIDGEPWLPVIKIRELNLGITEQSDRVAATIPEKWHIKDGDVLFSWSGTLLAKKWTGGNAALNQHLFKVTSTKYPKWFYFQWVLHHLEAFRSIAADKATTMGHIRRHHLTEALCVVPDSDSLSEMGATMEPIHRRWLMCELESRTLAELRDTLLPKLISGELRVPEAEQLVSEVA